MHDFFGMNIKKMSARLWSSTALLLAFVLSFYGYGGELTNPVLHPIINQQWSGLGIAYSPYRDGQSPQQNSQPTEKQILEDLTILTSEQYLSWHLIRLYAADEVTERVLKVIEEHNLPIRVMQGAWLSGKQSKEENEAQIKRVIELAKRFPNIIIAVNLGNEIFVDWSYHRFPKDAISDYLNWIKFVQENVSVPVTLADDYNFWNKPWSEPVAKQVDFIVLHAYAMWNSQTLDNALEWTKDVYQSIQSKYPEKQIVLGESGWATSSVSSNGDEKLIIAEASEKAQAEFFTNYRNWLKNDKIVSFYFQAFDEKWKGGIDKSAQIAEKNWGIYRSDRTPKLVVKRLSLDGAKVKVSKTKKTELKKNTFNSKNNPSNSRTILHYLGNEAVLVQGPSTKLLFDPFFHSHYGQYTLVPEAIRKKIFSNQPPFDNIAGIFVSHVHGDHFDANDTLRYLQQNEKVLLFISEQGRAELSQLKDYQAVADQIRAVNLKLGDKPVSLEFQDLSVDAVYIPHAGWPQRKDIQNIVFRVSAESQFTVAHFGDADANPDFYRQHKDHWDNKLTDVALVPYWLGLSPNGKTVINFLINSTSNIGIHVPVKGHPALPYSSMDYFSTPGEIRIIKQ